MLSSGLLVNAVFMVLTPEPSALGMGTAAGSGPGGGDRVGRTAALFCLGGLSPPAGVISLTSGLLASLCSHVISRGSSVESGTWRKGLTWESPWEWWVGGASGSGLECKKDRLQGPPPAAAFGLLWLSLGDGDFWDF